MRKISSLQISVFMIMYAIILILGIGTAWLLLGQLDLGDFRAIILIVASVVFCFSFAILIYRIFQFYFPLQQGEIEIDSRQEFIYHVYILFFVLIFYPVMRSGVPLFPVMRLVYLGLGAKLGDNTYCGGIIHDPLMFEAGENCLIGQSALIIPHVIENGRLAHYKIKIGNNVTIGANAVVMAGVTIEDNALVAIGAVIQKNTHIAEGEVWGGLPAKCIKRPSTDDI